MSLLLQYTLIFASVLILVALGGCFSEHSGVINLGLEGIMIMGALGGALTMRSMADNPSRLLVILAVILAAIILMQSKRSAGLGAVSGNSSDTYWSKNKGNSVEGALERYTKIGGALFMILALIINLVG